MKQYFIVAAEDVKENEIDTHGPRTTRQLALGVFHICQDGGRKDSFLCPNGTIFSQKVFVCVWWNEFDCNTAPSLYRLNKEIGKDESRNPVSMASSSIKQIY
ncbi:hypothetical protein C0J52_24226 [Blattella germanica]|nr:hypothetical protein C0J52_24226 [Blattella germanica]